MRRPTDPPPTRENVRDEVPPASGIIPDVENIAPSTVLAMYPPLHLVGVTKRIIETGIVSSQEEHCRTGQ